MSRDFITAGRPFDDYTSPVSGGPGPAMDCLHHHQAPSPGPFHYLISEQAKSLVALQELQHEVGALLEFRDLVIETFPNLRTKMAAAAVSSRPVTMSSVPVRRSADWEPGVRVRRKIHHKEESSSLGRCRSNSSSGKHAQPKSGDAASAIQDSGFSTETSSSKETHSAPTTAVAVAEPEDELWALLDLIHRKGSRIRAEAETLQGALERASAEPSDFERVLVHASAEDVRQLRRERDLLLDRLAEMEAEMLAGRAHTARLQADLEGLLAAKRDLEDQLKTVAEQRAELNTRIRDMHAQFVAEDDKASSSQAMRRSAVDARHGDDDAPGGDLCAVLGRGLPRVKVPDSRKFAAILRERDPLVLQRHLLSSTVHNQVLQNRLEASSRSKVNLTSQLDRAREENEDLRFQLEDRNIELEGTRARVRVLEQLQFPQKMLPSSPDVVPSAATPVLLRPEISPASMKAMSPLPLDPPSSSTESAHDLQQHHHQQEPQVAPQPQQRGRRRSSKIPLLWAKSYAAPKPPQTPQPQVQPAAQGPPSSLSKSRNSSLGPVVRSGNRDSLTGKVRNHDSLSKLRAEAAPQAMASPRRSSTPVRRTADSPDTSKASPSIIIPPYSGRPWLAGDVYPDSLDHQKNLGRRAAVSPPLFDSIESSSSMYFDEFDNPNNFYCNSLCDGGEGLAECDSLERLSLDQNDLLT